MLLYTNFCSRYHMLTNINFKAVVKCTFHPSISYGCRSQWPRGLRRRSAAARLLRSWVRIPPGAWMFVCCECCVLSGRGLCDELITRPEESYRLCCVVCDLETSRMGAPYIYIYIYIYDISRLRVKGGLQNLSQGSTTEKNAHMYILNWMQPSDLSNQVVFKPATANLF